MTRTANARLAGFMFLFYIFTGITSLILFNRATGGFEGAAEQLTSLARHPSLARVTVVLGLLTCIDALALAVALYGLTRDQDRNLAVLALSFRLGEGFVNAMSAIGTLQLLSVATAAAAASAADAAAANALGATLLKAEDSSYLISASLFAIGSTLYSYLFLRARSIPVWLAWLGVLGSLLLVVALPTQILGLIKSPVTQIVWIPVAVFEVVLGLWLLIKRSP